MARFDTDLANSMASSKNWVELKKHLGLFGSSKIDAPLKPFIELELQVIKHLQDGNYAAAVLFFRDVLLPTLDASTSIEHIKPLSNHLLLLVKEVKARYVFCFQWLVLEIRESSLANFFF